jgi:hypothetical protein
VYTCCGKFDSRKLISRRVNSWVRPLRKLRFLRNERIENKVQPFVFNMDGIANPTSPTMLKSVGYAAST